MNRRGAGFGMYIMLGLALAGILDAGYDVYAIHTGQELWCPPPIDGCNVVAASPYARIAGIPVGDYGLVYYAGMFALAAAMALTPASRTLRWGAVVGAAVGVMFSIYFMRVQFTYIHAFCVYCLISAVLTVLLLLVAVANARRSGVDLKRIGALPG